MKRITENCFRLKQSDQTLDGLEVPCEIGDEEAIQLGHSMMGNTSLKVMIMSVGTALTPHGARQLADGIAQLRLENGIGDSFLKPFNNRKPLSTTWAC